MMKTTHHSPDLLIFDHVPWLMGIGFSLLILLFVGIGLVPLGHATDPVWYLFSALFIVVGGGLWFMALVLFAKRLQFVFDRRSGRITLRRASVLRRTETSYGLPRLIEVRLETTTGSNGTGLQRPVLILRPTRHGASSETRVPLHQFYTSGAGPEVICETINTWLAQTETDRAHGD